MITITGVGEYDNGKPLELQEQAVIDYCNGLLQGSKTVVADEYCGENPDGYSVRRPVIVEYSDVAKGVKLVQFNGYTYSPNNPAAFHLAGVNFQMQNI